VPVFAYRAYTEAGRPTAGVVDADSQRAAWQVLRARGVYPTALDEARDAARASRRGGRVPALQLAAAMRQLAVLAGGSVPVADALAATAAGASHAELVAALHLARARVSEGESLADGLAASPHVFPALYRELVAAGELGGALPAVLARAAEHAERTAALRARLRAALAYPAMTAAATLAVLAFLLLWVVPQVSVMFAETKTPLPLTTRALLGLVAVLRGAWWLWLGLAATAVVGVRAWAVTDAGRLRLDTALLALPVVGRLAARLAVARVARTLATLLGSGVRVERALEMAAGAAGNARVAALTRDAAASVQHGGTLATALAAGGVVPPETLQLVATGEASGRLTETLEHAAAALESESEQTATALVSLLEPALVLLVGAAVLVVVLAVLVPVLTLNPMELG